MRNQGSSRDLREAHLISRPRKPKRPEPESGADSERFRRCLRGSGGLLDLQFSLLVRRSRYVSPSFPTPWRNRVPAVCSVWGFDDTASLLEVGSASVALAAQSAA